MASGCPREFLFVVSELTIKQERFLSIFATYINDLDFKPNQNESAPSALGNIANK